LVRPLDESLDPRECLVELLLRHRLLEMGERTELHAAARFLIRRNDVYRDVPRRLLMLEAIEDGPPFHVGELDVERDRIGCVAPREIEAALAARGHDRLEAFVVRHVDEDLRELHVVLDDQHDAVAAHDRLAIIGHVLLDLCEGRALRRPLCLRSHRRGLGGGQAEGRSHALLTLRRDVALRHIECERRSSSRQLSTRISPPSRRAISREIESPRPVPPYLRVVDASACWNASKKIFCLSSAIPTPVSVTRNAITVSARSSVSWPCDQPDLTGSIFSVTPPCSVNLNALPRRFLRICCSRIGSVRSVGGRLCARSISKPSPLSCATCRKLRSIRSRTSPNAISLRFSVIIPDSIFDRSRMSLMSVSRSTPDA